MTSELTKKVLAKMLRENTGQHFLDSGGAYGRHWERNQTREFEKEDWSRVSFRWGIEYTLNLFHFLCNALEYDKGLNNSYNSFDAKYSKENPYATYDESLEKWVERKGYKVIYSDYTYNQENNLDQDFIYWLMSSDQNASDLYDTEFCIIRVHGGCDARGGFTAPKIFRCDIDHLLNYADGCIYCESEYREHAWYTDDGYHWYSDNGDNNLEDYPRIDLEELEDELSTNEEYQIAINDQMVIDPSLQDTLPLPELSDYHPTVIRPVELPLQSDMLYFKDHTGYCPVCASKGILSKLLPG